MLTFEEVGFAYRGAGAPVLDGVSLRVKRGQRVVLLGRNGSGKSTCARLANGSLVPSEGQVLLANGKTPGPNDVGYVRQDPRAQLVSSVAGEDVAFGPSNLGLGVREVEKRVAGALAACGLGGMAERSVEEMSGGELQRLALASVVAMRPAFVVLDEVCSQLDQGSREGVRRVVDDLVASGTGVLEITHLVEDVLGADEVVVLAGGGVAWKGSVAEFLADEDAWGLAGLEAPELRALACLAGVGMDCTRASGAQVAEYARAHGAADQVLALLPSGANSGFEGAGCQAVVDAGERGLELRNVTVRYERELPPALYGATLRVAPGRVMLVAGASGSGKSTAALVAAGLLEPDGGVALLDGAPVRPATVGMAFQNVGDQLFCNTVLEDVMYGPLNDGASREDARVAAVAALESLGVEPTVWEKAPFALSGGQMRRVALAGIIAMAPRAYVFDEPTAGLDGEGRRELRGVIAGLAAAGAAVVVVSHDVGEWLPVADDVVAIGGGRVVAAGTAADALQRRGFFSSAGLAAPLWIELRDALLEEAVAHA